MDTETISLKDISYNVETKITSYRRELGSEFKISDFLKEFNKKGEEVLEKIKKSGQKIEDESQNTLEFINYFYPVLTQEQGEEVFSIILNEKHSRFADFEIVDGCFRQKEYPPLKFTLEVPSGFLAVGNDFRSIGDGKSFKDEDFDINTVVGTIQTTESYAEQGLAHGFVGNSCPVLFWNEKENLLSIGAELKKEFADYPEAEEEEDYEWTNPVDPDLKEVGYICTDLWWYSIMDRDKYVEMGGVLDHADIIEVPAGTYEFEHHYGISLRGYHSNQAYATAKKKIK